MTGPVSNGDARTKDSTEGGPALSNYLTMLAVEVAGQIAVYKRSSTAANRAYLTAGAKLLEARKPARHGQWAAVPGSVRHRNTHGPQHDDPRPCRTERG